MAASRRPRDPLPGEKARGQCFRVGGVDDENQLAAAVGNRLGPDSRVDVAVTRTVEFGRLDDLVLVGGSDRHVGIDERQDVSQVGSRSPRDIPGCLSVQGVVRIRVWIGVLFPGQGNRRRRFADRSAYQHGIRFRVIGPERAARQREE